MLIEYPTSAVVIIKNVSRHAMCPGGTKITIDRKLLAKINPAISFTSSAPGMCNTADGDAINQPCPPTPIPILGILYIGGPTMMMSNLVASPTVIAAILNLHSSSPSFITSISSGVSTMEAKVKGKGARMSTEESDLPLVWGLWKAFKLEHKG